MVEKNFENRCSEMTQNERFLRLSIQASSPWLKKILKIDVLKCTKVKDF